MLKAIEVDKNATILLVKIVISAQPFIPYRYTLQSKGLIF